MIVFDAESAAEAQLIGRSKCAKHGMQAVKDLFDKVGDFLVLAFHAECAKGSYLKEACVDGMAALFFVSLTCNLLKKSYKIVFWDPNYDEKEKKRCFQMANVWCSGKKAHIMMGDCCGICRSAEETAALYCCLGDCAECIVFDHHVLNVNNLKAHVEAQPNQNTSFKYIQTTLSCNGNPTTYDAFLMLDRLGGINQSLHTEMHTIALLAALSDACTMKQDLIPQYVAELEALGYKQENITQALYHQDFLVQQSSDCMIDKWMSLMQEDDEATRNTMAEEFQKEMQHYLSLNPKEMAPPNKTLRQKYAEIIKVLKGEMPATIKKKRPDEMKKMLEKCLPKSEFNFRDGAETLKFVFFPEDAAKWGRPAAMTASELCAEKKLAGILFAQQDNWSLRVDLGRFKPQGRTAHKIANQVLPFLLKQHYPLSSPESLDQVQVAGHPWACVIGPTASKEKLVFGWRGNLRFAQAVQFIDYSAQTTGEVVTKTSVSQEGREAKQDAVMKRPAGVSKKPSSKVHMFAFLIVVFLVAYRQLVW